MSASLFTQSVRGQQEFLNFWNEERRLLLERNKEGFRAIDVGPLTMGYRLMSTKAGFDIPRHLIYPKGGYVLHMIRMMMWNPRTGDEAFRSLMQDYAKTYANGSASTEDFKMMVEKHMLPEMNLENSNRMDWFFNQYVYGTALPNYKLDYSFDRASDGNIRLNFKLTQSNVYEQFRMLVPIYLELANGQTVRLGAATIVGNSMVDQHVPLNGLKDQPKRAMLNYFNDVLCTVDGK